MTASEWSVAALNCTDLSLSSSLARTLTPPSPASTASFPHASHSTLTHLLSFYPVGETTPTPFENLASVVGDVYFRAPERFWLRRREQGARGGRKWGFEWGVKRWGAEREMGGGSFSSFLDSCWGLFLGLLVRLGEGKEGEGEGGKSPRSDLLIALSRFFSPSTLAQHGADLKSWFGHPDTSTSPSISRDGVTKARGSEEEEKGRDDAEILETRDALVGYFL